MPATRAQLNRKVRQEALRDQLSSQGHIQHVIDMVDKIRDPAHPLADDMLARYKVAIDAKFKLIAKYAPDLKNTELTADGGEPLGIEITYAGVKSSGKREPKKSDGSK